MSFALSPPRTLTAPDLFETLPDPLAWWATDSSDRTGGDAELVLIRESARSTYQRVTGNSTAPALGNLFAEERIPSLTKGPPVDHSVPALNESFGTAMITDGSFYAFYSQQADPADVHRWRGALVAKCSAITSRGIGVFGRALPESIRPAIAWPLVEPRTGNEVPSPQHTTTSILSTVMPLLSSGNVREAIKEFARVVERFRLNRDWPNLSAGMLRIDIDALPRELWVALLRETFSIRTHLLPAWPIVYDRIEEALKKADANPAAFFVGLQKARSELRYSTRSGK